MHNMYIYDCTCNVYRVHLNLYDCILHAHCTFRVDIVSPWDPWHVARSGGVVLYALLCGSLPFDDENVLTGNDVFRGSRWRVGTCWDHLVRVGTRYRTSSARSNTATSLCQAFTSLGWHKKPCGSDIMFLKCQDFGQRFSNFWQVISPARQKTSLSKC